MRREYAWTPDFSIGKSGSNGGLKGEAERLGTITCVVYANGEVTPFAYGSDDVTEKKVVRIFEQWRRIGAEIG